MSVQQYFEFLIEMSDAAFEVFLMLMEDFDVPENEQIALDAILAMAED